LLILFCVAKLAEAEGYWLPCQAEVQGMHLDAQHRVRLWQENKALPSQQVQEVCCAQRLWAGASYDAQEAIYLLYLWKFVIVKVYLQYSYSEWQFSTSIS
jgi:hypothetical protein